MADESKTTPEVIEGHEIDQFAKENVEALPAPTDDNIVDAIALTPITPVSDAVVRYAMLRSFVANVMVKDIDYGPAFEGSKDVLLKPGAEKLTRFFGLTVDLQLADKVQRWDENPMFFYRYSCDLYRHGILITRAYGSCNSKEDRYAWRWVQFHQIPEGVDVAKLKTRDTVITEFDFAVQNAETTGKYGKPTEYWTHWNAMIENGTAKELQKEARSGKSYKAWEIATMTYRIPNPDIFTQVNTIDKQAQKRALVAGALIACGASEYFTQDLEDMQPTTSEGTPTLQQQHQSEADSIKADLDKASPEEIKERGQAGAALLYGDEDDERKLIARFKATFDARVIEHKGHRRNKDLHTKLILPLLSIFEGLAKEAENHRHAAQAFLTGKASITKWNGAEMLALLRCLGVDEKTLEVNPKSFKAMRLAARAQLEVD